MPRLPTAAPAQRRFETYVCEHWACDRGVHFDLWHRNGWTPNLMRAKLLADGWTYLRPVTYRLDEPRGWRCPLHGPGSGQRSPTSPSWVA